MRKTAIATLLSTLATLTVTAGCGPFWTPIGPEPVFVAIRASSLPYLGLAGSTRHVSRRREAARDELTALFDKRGYHVTAEYVAADASHDTVYRYAVAPSLESAFGFGSAFFVVLHTAGPAQTDVVVLGKPLSPNGELCSDADALLGRFGYTCVDSLVWTCDGFVRQPTGKPEADVARGVLQELGDWAAS